MTTNSNSPHIPDFGSKPRTTSLFKREQIALQSTSSDLFQDIAQRHETHTETFPLPHTSLPPVPHIRDIDEYRKLYKQSIENPELFWDTIARNNFYWKRKWDTVVKYNFSKQREQPIFTEWFGGATTNICYNAVDRHILAGIGDRTAFLFEPNDPNEPENATPASKRMWTYSDVHNEVQRIANVLKSMNVKKGDCVALYMPMIVELPIAMLACARIGAVHSVVFGGFSAEALAGRMVDSQSKVLITCDGVMRASKVIPLKKIADEACALCASRGHHVEHQLIVQRQAQQETLGADSGISRVWWHEAAARADPQCDIEWVDSEAPLFVLYTSGSTGKPKGIVHTTGGYMVYSATTFKHAFEYHPRDIYFCTADCGWITGHSYVTYGPLLNVATQVIFEGVPSFPDYGRLWAIVAKHRVTQLYTAPTAVRALKSAGNDFVTAHDRSSLRVLGTVGEPINPEAWRWYFAVVGDSKCAIVDTWWQTETGGHMLLPLPIKGMDLKPGSASLPFFGVVPAVLDEHGNELDGPADGFLAIKSPWPSTLRTIHGDHARMEQVYFERFDGYYLTGDGCRRDADGFYWLTGRIDDVLNVSGHRIGTAEVESALVLHANVSEAAVVGVAHDIKGEGIYAYVSLDMGFEGSDQLKKELIALVRAEIGPIASPDVIHWAPALPKTRSGKIMRRILRKIAEKGPKVSIDELGDISTLADSSVIEMLISGHAQSNP